MARGERRDGERTAKAAATAPPSARSRVRRNPGRGVYEPEAVHAIIDEALFCHVGVIVDGAPRVVPMIHARIDDTLYLHGSTASAAMRTLVAGGDACVTITLLDGLVLARSAFGHSMNYRSVLVYGAPREVVDPDERWAAQRALVEHVVPGRAADARPPTERELGQTLIAAVSLAEASAKVRTGPPIEAVGDLGLPVWAGELPIALVAGPPVPDDRTPDDVPVPGYLTRYRRGAGGSRERGRRATRHSP